MLLVAALSSCADSPAPPVAGRQAALLAPDEAGPVRVALRLVPDHGRETGEVVVRATWGAGEAQLGKRDEGSRPGPTSLAVGPAGEIFVLDAVNRRVSRFGRTGAPRGQLQLEGETAEDLVVVGGDQWILFYEPGTEPGYRLRRYRDGRRLLDQGLGRGLDLVTGLFVSGEAAAPDLWVEQRHEQQRQVVTRGEPVPPAVVGVLLVGRPDPARPGTRLLASRGGPRLAVVERHYPGRYTSRLLEVATPLPLVAVDDLLTDGAAGLYLSLLVGVEKGPPDHGWRELHRLLVVHRDGQTRTIGLATISATDGNRTLAVGRDGAVHALETSAEGVVVRRWALAADGGAR